MKKSFILLVAFLLGLSDELSSQNPINFIRIGETNPSCAAYVFGTGEQLSGQQFQTDGIKTYKGYQYTVYYNQTRNVCIARRKLPVGRWQEVVLPYKNAVDDAHNVISMGICEKDGSIHLAYDHHNSDLHYCYSIAGSANDPEHMPWETGSFCATTDIMDKAVPNVTYPRFISKPDGNLLFECRFRWSGYGDSYLREYNGDTKKWTLIGRYVQGEDVDPDACAYINGMTYDRLGRLHVTWCWRDDFGGGSNHDFYYGYSEDDGRTWKDTFGEQNATTENMEPVESHTTGTCMGQTKKSFMIEAIPYNKGYINQETQAVDSKGRIHAVNSFIPGSETDANWASSRKKARLHHRFRNTDGTWKTVQVKNNGETVNSYSRVNLSFDAFDNAFVVANGAEVYCATDANGYDDWNLMSDADKGRFLSEPLVDRSLLLNEGILSFVYLGADNKITVIDYLLDNPNLPSGTGLKAEYFADTDFTSPVKTEIVGNISTASIPQNTQSVRWSGTFETSYAEAYTLYLNTAAPTTVYIDGIKVLLTRKTENTKEYAFTFAPIASHKHNLIIESQTSATGQFSLSWASPKVTKEIIPVQALYPDFAYESSADVNDHAPELDRKNELKEQLLGTSVITDKQSIIIPAFNPAGDYTVEIKAQIVSSPDCGLVLEGRTANGKGFRIALGETSLSWMAPYTASTLLTVADNREEQTYRLAVKGDKAFVYQGEDYITSVDLSLIGDLNDDGEEVMPTPQITDLNLAWAGSENKGSGKPSDYGWENTVAGIAWNDANAGGGVRFMDVVSGHTYNGSAYQGRIMTIRWDGSYGTYSFPVTLEANTSYEFSMLYEWWNNGSPNSISVGISASSDALEPISMKSFSTASKNVLQKAVFSFTSREAGEYYLVFNGQSGVMYGIAELELNKIAYLPKLALSKYCSGSSDIKIANIMYEDGAYAPGENVPDVELEVKKELPELIDKDIRITGAAGSKEVSNYVLDIPEDYTIEIKAAISDCQGRGMDFEVRNEEGMGFRTALSNSEFNWIAPYSLPQSIGESSTREQTVRYAVKGNKVYLYRDGLFVKTFAAQSIGDMDNAGVTENVPYSNTDISSSANLITNPAFQNTADNGAPEGWTSNGELGVSGGARVQQKSSTTELSAYPDGTKAFLVRFDGVYTWFSNEVTLKADTWYEYSFDLIAWGNNTGKTLGLTVSTAEAGTGEVVLNQMLTTPAIRATGERNIVRFKTIAAGTYYLTFAKTGTLTGTVGLTDLCLVEHSLNHLLVGKNYTQGTAAMSIDYISYDPTGAFAPLPQAVNIVAEQEDKQGLDISTQKGLLTVIASHNILNISVFDISGRTVCSQKTSGHIFTTPLSSGLYIINLITERQERFVEKIMIP
ncbi:BNR-4 repeat-containing protein [Bacteroides sp.]